MASPTPNGGSPRMPLDPRKPRLIVDPPPRAKKKISVRSPKPKAKKVPVVKPLPIKKAPKKQNPIKVAPPSPDDKIYRTMPITEKQLNGIKKMYGIR